MKRLVLAAVFLALLQALLLVPFAGADDEVPTAKEVMQAEGMPPLIPHPLPKPGKGGQPACLNCHAKGKNGAPPTPHAERRMCSQCHVPGPIVAKLGKKKK